MEKIPEYQVSVITPFHNVDMDMFRRGYRSLQCQSIGFENIQWIVVLHNTKPEIRAEVENLLAGQENVLIPVLDNDVHSPSSPRNYGLQLATAPYVGFLDGDDSFTPLCLQTTVEKMKKHAAQMVVFRREYELEREGLFPLTEIVLWDQTKEEIIIERDNWDDIKMFSGIWGMVTSRLFDRNFLLENNITFDETVPYAEDILFIIEAYGKADRICYLPQFIGYHYFINGGSAVQSMANQSGKVLISYAEGFRRIFDAAFRNGIYVDFLLANFLTMFAEAMINAKELTLADRQVIKECLEPYVRKIPVVPTSKLCNEHEARLWYELPREVILHPESFDKGRHIQSLWNGEGTLLEILRHNKDTDYGQRYYFAGLQAAEGYQARVPLSSYNRYAPLIQLQTQIGEHGIFVADPVRYYLLTENAAGDTQLFPATRRHLEPYVRAFTDMVRDKTTFPLLESLPKSRAYNDRGSLNSLTGVIFTEFFWQERNTLQGSQAKFTTPEELLFPTEALDVLYLRVLFALKEREVEQLIAPSTWGIVETLTFMEKHWETICRDIEQGEISFVIDVSDTLLKRMKGHLNGDKERADELRRAFSAGFDAGVLSRVWPKLKRIVAFGDNCFRIYTERLRKYSGGIDLEHGYFMISEALVGESIEGTGQYRLLKDQNFYEFLPLTAADGDKPCFLSNLKEGEIYELIVTNRAGLYRYRTGYFIRAEECGGSDFIFSLAGRRGQSVQAGGATFSEADVYQAITGTAEKHGLDIMDYAFYADESGMTIFLEPAGTEELCGILSYTGTETIAASLDTFLQEGNPDYAGHCKILWSEPQTHLLYRDLRRYREQSAPYQIEPTHFLNTPEKIKFFTQNTWQG